MCRLRRPYGRRTESVFQRHSFYAVHLALLWVTFSSFAQSQTLTASTNSTLAFDNPRMVATGSPESTSSLSSGTLVKVTEPVTEAALPRVSSNLPDKRPEFAMLNSSQNDCSAPSVDTGHTPVPATDRPNINGDNGNGSTIIAVERPSLELRPTLHSRVIACEVAEHWLPAKQLRQHATALRRLYCKADDCSREAAEAGAQFLETQAEHQLDIAAATGLRAYFLRSSLEEQVALIQQSMALVESRVTAQRAATDKGLALPVDPTALDRERIEAVQQRLQVSQRAEQLQRTIEDLSGNKRDWINGTLEPIVLYQGEIDVPSMQQFAMRCRSDLRALIQLQPHIHDETAGMLASAVSGIAGLSALPLPKPSLMDRMLGRKRLPGLAKSLRQELAIARESLEKSIKQTIADKSSSLQLAYQRIQLSREILDSWNLRIQQLDALAARGEYRLGDKVAAQLGIIQAQATIIERRLEAKLLEIDLAEAIGGLKDRCCNPQIVALGMAYGG